MKYLELIEKVKNNEPFSFFRWGDGEFMCMGEVQGRNCDKHEYTPSLAAELRNAYAAKNNKRAHFGIQGHALRTQPQYSQYYADLPAMNEYADADIFVNASINGELELFTDALKGKNVIFVAPERYKHLKHFEFKHIDIPDLNCFDVCDSTLYRLRQQVLNNSEKCIILYSASMMSNVLMSRILQMIRGIDYIQIDVGSVFEPYIGNANRKYHKQILERLNN